MACLLAAVLAGCGFQGSDGSFPQRRPLGAEHESARAEWDRTGEVAKTADPVEPEGQLTLRTALALALAKNPKLESFAWSVRQAEAERLQAGVLPNPKLEAEFENFAGSGEFRGTRGLETTIALSQLVELGDKRRKRARLADTDSKLAGWDYEAGRLAVFTAVTGQFIKVLATQDKLALAREDLKLAEATGNVVSGLVEAGKGAMPQKLKASVEVAWRRIDVQRIQRELIVARSKLAALWGASKPLFERVVGDWGAVRAIPSLDALAAGLAQNPEVARWDTELQQRRDALALEKAKGIPDLTVGVGYRHFRETDDNDTAMLVTVGVPLPLFDRNRGAVTKARMGILKARADQHAAATEIRAELEEVYQTLAATRDEVISLRDKVLPAAEKSHEAAEQSFRQGKAGFLDVIDAQRTLIKAKQQYIDALASHHQAAADLEGLIGRPLDEIQEDSSKKKETNNANE